MVQKYTILVVVKHSYEKKSKKIIKKIKKTTLEKKINITFNFQKLQFLEISI